MSRPPVPLLVVLLVVAVFAAVVWSPWLAVIPAVGAAVALWTGKRK